MALLRICSISWDFIWLFCGYIASVGILYGSFTNIQHECGSYRALLRIYGYIAWDGLFDRNIVWVGTHTIRIIRNTAWRVSLRCARSSRSRSVMMCSPITGSISSRLGPRPVLQWVAGVAGCCRVVQGVTVRCSAFAAHGQCFVSTRTPPWIAGCCRELQGAGCCTYQKYARTNNGCTRYKYLYTYIYITVTRSESILQSTAFIEP